MKLILALFLAAFLVARSEASRLRPGHRPGSREQSCQNPCRRCCSKKWCKDLVVGLARSAKTELLPADEVSHVEDALKKLREGRTRDLKRPDGDCQRSCPGRCIEPWFSNLVLDLARSAATGLVLSASDEASKLEKALQEVKKEADLEVVREKLHEEQHGRAKESEVEEDA